jgi:hypothetical protein
MIDTRRRPEDGSTPRDARSRRTPASTVRRRRAASFSDAVIAAYIHDLHHAATPNRVETHLRGATGEEH